MVQASQQQATVELVLDCESGTNIRDIVVGDEIYLNVVEDFPENEDIIYTTVFSVDFTQTTTVEIDTGSTSSAWIDIRLTADYPFASDAVDMGGAARVFDEPGSSGHFAPESDTDLEAGNYLEPLGNYGLTIETDASSTHPGIQENLSNHVWGTMEVTAVGRIP